MLAAQLSYASKVGALIQVDVVEEGASVVMRYLCVCLSLCRRVAWVAELRMPNVPCLLSGHHVCSHACTPFATIYGVSLQKRITFKVLRDI